MPTTIVCQNLMSSCNFESQVLNETTRATLKLKVADNINTNNHNNNEFGNWGFLQTTPNKGKNHHEGSTYTTYTHPFAQNSSFSSTRLSPISLELCTESLGSETGSDIITDDIDIFSSSIEKSSSYERRVVEHESYRQKKTRSITDNSRKSFPPPLTSSLQVRRHTEGGRLIIEAVEAPFRNSYLQAERSEGRLKLCFLTSSDVVAEASVASASLTEDDKNKYENENEDEIITVDEKIEELISSDTDESATSDEFNDEEIVNSEIGIEKFKWLSRCNEGGHGNKGLCNNWKPALWVATS